MKSSVSQYNEEVCDDIFLLLADEMPLFVKDHNPDPSLIHSHLEHTHEEAEDAVGGSEEKVETITKKVVKVNLEVRSIGMNVRACLTKSWEW